MQKVNRATLIRGLSVTPEKKLEKRNWSLESLDVKAGLFCGGNYRREGEMEIADNEKENKQA
ncbi:hypothetical protein EOI67_22465 [Salmonella enterica]|nr:hypothetical protein [Salmonella enterica]EAS9893412.1 hypothetical protein [Salmonella enterica]EEG2848497.1 hypothetical protein [Salmonella enterica]EEO3567747.1 hypothetical protein [Salmonella enterica subsp. enterica serovar Poona]EHZ8203751.1 hypothetical protein [Salmonella enterica]